MLERVIAETEIVLLAGLSSDQQTVYYEKELPPDELDVTL
jgi:hypothetical protein